VADTIARLSRERGATCVLVGAASDRDSGREIESSLPPDVRAINLIGRTGLREFAGVLARCRAFVSNDSGAMHLAAAVGVPVVAIFGPTNERVTAPLGAHDVLVHQVFCRPCMLRDCPIDHRCMKGITVASVFDAVSRRLEARV
jgi:heptosyltransferase-2